MFNDHAFRDGVGLAGVNSINWARVLAQTVYYFTAAVARQPGQQCILEPEFGGFASGTDIVHGRGARGLENGI